MGTHRRLFGEPAHPEGHDGDGHELGEAVEDAGEGPVQHLGVVQARADDHLAVDLDAVVEQAAQPPQAHGAAAVAEHAGAHDRVGSVYRDIERREPLLEHPLEVGLGETGQCREVAVEEREPVVVVLQVQAAAQPLWELVDEAELAVVVAGADAVEYGSGDLEPERLARLLLDRDLELHPSADDLEVHDRLVRQQLVLDDVPGHLAVDRAKLVTRPDSATLSRRMLGHGHHLR